MQSTWESPFSRLKSPFFKSIVPQAFRKETGDGGTVITESGAVYKLNGILGVGGLSVVYTATRFTDGEVVALKLPNATKDGLARDMIKKEARIMTRLNHPNIIKVVDQGRTSDGEPFLAMELIRGQTLDKLMMANGGRLPLRRAVKICLQAAEALEYAHKQGVLHRDIKPSNIIVRPQNGEDFVSIFDFGISKSDDNDNIGDDSGSLLYVSPEQLTGRACTARSDIYQLALVFFEVITGRLPFELSVSGAVNYRTDAVPVLLDDVELGDCALAKSVRSVLEKALARNPKERHASMHLFAHQLRQALIKTRMKTLRHKEVPQTELPVEPQVQTEAPEVLTAKGFGDPVAAALIERTVEMLSI